MKIALKALLPTLSLALIAATPFARGQDMNGGDTSSAPSSAPSASADQPSDQTPPPAPKKRGGKGGRRDPLTQALSKVSNLTDDENSKIQQIRSDMRDQMQNLPDDDTRREKMRQLMTDTAGKVRDVLTPDQQTEFDTALKRAMRNGKKKAQSEDSAPPAPPPSDSAASAASSSDAPPPPPPSNPPQM